MNELEIKIAQMRRGLENPNIAGAVRDTLQTALAKAEQELAAQQQASAPPKQTLGDIAKVSPNIIIARPEPMVSRPDIKKFSWSDYPLAKKFMPKHQQRVVSDMGEEREPVLKQVEEMLSKIPGAYKQENERDPMVFAHYFYGQSDWFITEYHKDREAFFGFVILNGDSQMAELGYSSVDELVNSNRIELDFYWRPKRLSEAKAEADPEMWGESDEDTSTTEKAIKPLDAKPQIKDENNVINLYIVEASKLNDLDEYKERFWTKGYEIEKAEIREELVLSNKDFMAISNSLLADRDEWNDKDGKPIGGAYSKDPRLEGVTQEQLWKDEKLMQIFRDTSISLYIKVTNKDTGESFYVNTGGYNYVRYVGFDKAPEKPEESRIYNEQHDQPEMVSFDFGIQIQRKQVWNRYISQVKDWNKIPQKTRELLELLGFEKFSGNDRDADEDFTGKKLSMELKNRLLKAINDTKTEYPEKKKEVINQIAKASNTDELYELWPIIKRLDLSKYKTEPVLLPTVVTPYFQYVKGPTQIMVRTDYNPDVVAAARKLNGTWSGNEKLWKFDIRDEDQVKSFLRDIFGTDGDSEAETVDVKVYLDKVPYSAYQSNYGHSVFALGRQLAHRKYRDNRVILGNKVTIVAGGFPSTGGSAKNPRLNEVKGTVLLVRDVPRAIVEKDELNCEGCYEIVQNEAAKETKSPEILTDSTAVETADVTAQVKTWNNKEEVLDFLDRVAQSLNRYEGKDKPFLGGLFWSAGEVLQGIKSGPEENPKRDLISNMPIIENNEAVKQYLEAKGFVFQDVISALKWTIELPEEEKPQKTYNTRLVRGKERPIILPNGAKHQGQFAVIEMDDILASHNEETFADTPGYPLNSSGNNLNDRNYANDRSAQLLVENYAQNLNPDLLIALNSGTDGTPIVVKDNDKHIVVSGNNRVMSLKLAAKKYPAKYTAYKEALNEQIDSFGFKDSDFTAISNMKQPVLVRIDYDFGEFTTTNMAKYNASSMKAKNPLDRAFELSTTLREQVLCQTRIPEQISTFDTLSDFYANRNATKAMVEALKQCNVLNDQDLPSVLNNGLFTDEGKMLVERVLSASVLEPDVVRCADRDGVRTLRQAVVYALPALMKHKSLPAEAQLTTAINKAVCWQSDLVASGASFMDFVGQEKLFDTDKPSREALALNRLMASGQRRFRDAISKYTESQAAASAGPALFGSENQVSPKEAFEGYIFSALSEAEQKAINRTQGMIKYPKGSEVVFSNNRGEEHEGKNAVVMSAILDKPYNNYEVKIGQDYVSVTERDLMWPEDYAKKIGGTSPIKVENEQVNIAKVTVKLLTKTLPKLQGEQKKMAEIELKLLTKFLAKNEAV